MTKSGLRAKTSIMFTASTKQNSGTTDVAKDRPLHSLFEYLITIGSYLVHIRISVPMWDFFVVQFRFGLNCIGSYKARMTVVEFYFLNDTYQLCLLHLLPRPLYAISFWCIPILQVELQLAIHIRTSYPWLSQLHSKTAWRCLADGYSMGIPWVMCQDVPWIAGPRCLQPLWPVCWSSMQVSASWCLVVLQPLPGPSQGLGRPLRAAPWATWGDHFFTIAVKQCWKHGSML